VKARFIFNPYSGHNRRNPHLRLRAAAFIQERGLDATVVDTLRPGHGAELAAAAVREGCGLVVAIGGDGTMNEVASALVDTPVLFGLIPCGSGNGLGRHVGIRRPDDGAFHTLLHGRPLPIDTGLVNGFPFFNAMGLGLEADIALRFSRQTNRGLAGYIRVGWPAYLARRPETVAIHHRQGTTRLAAFTLAVMNSDQYGNDARVAPGAKLDDGQFELISVPAVSLLGACHLLYRLGTDSFDQVRTVTRLSAADFVIERPAPGWIHTDGEPRATTAQLAITLKPSSLRIMVPTD
jgi:diacylglycerol kinase (ATP)